MSNKKLNHVQFKDCFELPNNGLRAYLRHVEEGNDEDYRTPLFNEAKPSKVLDRWSKILEPGIKSFDGLQDYENDLRDKVGPLSLQKPLKERMDDIDSYYECINLHSKPVSAEAIDALLKDWLPKIGGLRLRSPTATWEQMQKSTNSGSPYFKKRRKVWEQHGSSFEVKLTSTQIDSKYWSNCAVLGWRGQEGGPDYDDVKQRVVWMFPMYVNVAELQLYQPLVEACQKFNLVPAWNGNDAVDLEITKLFDSKAEDDLVVCTDFSKFDQHFNLDLQRCADEVLRALSGSVPSRWFEQVFPIKFQIPLCYKWDNIRVGFHGMGSGSGGTNADETIAHRCLQLEAALSNGRRLNPHSMCLGDDGILTYPGISVEQVLESYTPHGLEMNETKQFASTYQCVYLRRWHSTKYRVNDICAGVYSTYRALGRLMYQERFYNDWSPEMVVLRSLSILENCRYHPMKEEFLDFVLKGDKYRLGLGIPGFFDRIGKTAKEAVEKVKDFMSYTQRYDTTGINDWWVVKALKSKLK